MIIALIAISAFMLAAALVACIKPGREENIVKYDNIEE
jgi:hypothetical protein